MSDNIDLDILKSTLSFLEENCVGPQRGYYLFNTLKKKYENLTAFSYSYFISLFDNNETINKALVRNQIDKYEHNNQSNCNTIVNDISNQETITNGFDDKEDENGDAIKNDEHTEQKTNSMVIRDLSAKD